MGNSFRLAALASALLAPCALAGQPVYHPIGPALTQGNISSKYNLSSSLHNPAASHVMFNREEDERWRIGVFGPVGFGYEVGQVDDLLDELDELIDILDDDNLSADDALDAKDRFEPFLQQAEVDGYVKASLAGMIPVMPIMYHNPDIGTFSFEIMASGELKGSVLADDINVLVLDDGYQLNTNSAMYVKSAVQVNFALGYNRSVWAIEQGELIAGLKVNITSMEMSKNILSFSGLDSDEDIADVIEDEYEKNSLRSTEVGVDLGLLWLGENYSVGLTVTDVNEPEFEYASIVSDCSGLTGATVDNCFSAQEFISAGKIKGNEVYVANSQATLEASYYFGESQWLGLHASIDLNDKNDPVGDLYQWSTVSMSFETGTWVLPQLRLGYSQNSKGSELSYYNIGMTLLNNFYLDVRWADTEVEIDDSTGPRGGYINLGFQSQF